MMPMLPVVRAAKGPGRHRGREEVEHNYRHTAIIHSHDVNHMTAMGWRSTRRCS